MHTSLLPGYTRCMLNQPKSLGRFLTTLATVLFLGVMNAQAANRYVRAGAAGAATGADWTNAYATLPATLVRGDVYYIASGNYGTYTFDDAASGTQVITIKKATIADHGASTGWSDAFGVGQAHFACCLEFLSSYWVMDGVMGSMSQTPADYGFVIDKPSCSGGYQAITVGNTVGPSFTNFTFSHIYSQACTQDVEKLFFSSGYQIGQVDNVTISHCLLDRWQNGMMSRGQGNGTNDNWIWEYNIGLNGASTPANHGEWINANSLSLVNTVVRHSLFKGASGGQTATIVGNNSDLVGAKVYGNVFDGVDTGNGIIAGTSVADLVNAEVYNNTFLNSTAQMGWINGYNGTGNVAYNNVLYNMDASVGNGVTHSNNSYFQTTNTPAETNRQTGSINPFVNSAGGNYRLAAATTAGMTLPAPYAIDPDGNTRGADGTWDRGAYEYVSGSVPVAVAPMAPRGLAFR